MSLCRRLRRLLLFLDFSALSSRTPNFLLILCFTSPEQVGWAFAFFAVPLALYCLLNPSAALEVDPLYGISTRETRLSALAVGYFAWVRLSAFFPLRREEKQVLITRTNRTHS
jgi:hypothetical protein